MDKQRKSNAQPIAGIIPFTFPNIPTVHCVFTTALWGNISLAEGTGESTEVVLARREKLQRHCGFARWAELYQVHGETILKAKASELHQDNSQVPRADAHHTAETNLALVSKTADCQPILLAHKSGKYIAAVHSGWRGNVCNIPGKTVHAFCKAYAIQAKDVLAVRGPSLGPGAAEFVNVAQEWPEAFLPWFTPENRCMNLWELTKHQLQEAGVARENIFGLDLCTRDLEAYFFSHRRKDAGRQCALIWRQS